MFPLAVMHRVLFPSDILKATLMQIWKFLCIFGLMKKQYPENFAFLIKSILELFTREDRIFLKN